MTWPASFESKIAVIKAQLDRPGTGKAFKWLAKPNGEDCEPEDLREAVAASTYAQFELLVQFGERFGESAHLWYGFLGDALQICIDRQISRDVASIES